VLSERLFSRLPGSGIDATSKNLAIKGKREVEPVRVIDFGAVTTQSSA
jgi:hypothetical protein